MEAFFAFIARLLFAFAVADDAPEASILQFFVNKFFAKTAETPEQFICEVSVSPEILILDVPLIDMLNFLQSISNIPLDVPQKFKDNSLKFNILSPLKILQTPNALITDKSLK